MQLFLIFYALPQLGVKIDPFPAAVIAFSLNVGGYAAEIVRSAILRPQGPVGGRRDRRHGLRDHPAADHPAAGRPDRGPAAVEHPDLAGQGHLARGGHPGDRAAPGGPARGGADFEFLALYGMAAVYYWVICLVLSFVQSRTETRLNRFVAHEHPPTRTTSLADRVQPGLREVLRRPRRHRDVVHGAPGTVTS